MSNDRRPVVVSFALGDFQTNCYVVTVPPSRRCWIVDCGENPRVLLDFIEREGLQPDAILLTHCHCDHIAGLDDARAWAARRGIDLPVIGPTAERGFCSTPELNLSAFVDQPVSVGEPSRWLEGGETLELDGTQWAVLATPGHSPGGLTFHHEPSHQALVGDTLFAGGIGRVDFPTSDPAKLRRSLHEVLLALPDTTAVYPGHGPATTVGRERRTNPFLAPGARW